MDIIRYILLIVTIYFCLPTTGLAQKNISMSAENIFFQTIRANQDESYITFGQGIGNMEPLVFEGMIAPYFLLRTSKNSKWGATVSPKIILRMFAEESVPVRTPSYMPNVTFYRQLATDSEHTKIQYIYLTLAHHSNGQDGEFYNHDNSVNTYSGNFSTNYIEIGTFFNRRKKSIKNIGEFFQTSLEIHLDLLRSQELEGQYSFVRWHNNIRIFRLPQNWFLSKFSTNPRVQTTIETTWLFGDINKAGFFDVNERLNVSLTINYRLKVLRDVSLFANYFTGEDYYNMQYFRRINVFRVGIQAYSFN